MGPGKRGYETLTILSDDRLRRVFGRSGTIETAPNGNVWSEGVRDAVVARLAELIVKGTWSASQPLPNEDLLCEQLGVSRTSVREALRSLAAKGMVETRPRTGTTVLPKHKWSRLDPEVLRWTYEFGGDSEFDKSLVEARGVIEPAAAEMAADRATTEQIDEMRRALATMSENFATDPELSCLADLQFHRTLIQASHNAVLIQLGTAMSAALLASFRRITSLAKSHAPATDAHELVLAAIERRDPKAAGDAMRTVLKVAMSRFNNIA
ncbi:MAG: FadR/GntR family transcriptional regulator [Devosia sp.]